ncbi:MAG: sialate O-acetylesterase [Verrucomicrobiales bacterium]|nr:sialate O-acetylesterase [Verrucomicrobiales bacterium]
MYTRFLLPLIFALTSHAAELRLPHVFGDHMLLQRDKPVTVWGWAKPDSKVTVTFAGQEKSTTADKDTTWSLQLDPLTASSDPQSLTVTSNDETVTKSDILVGELWLCGGQSNMAWSLRGSRDADIEIPAADHTAIRFLRLPNIASNHPQHDFPVDNPESPTGNWRTATSDQVENMTGVGYFFAVRLHHQLKVPVGIIDNSWGGTMAQHWCNLKTLIPIPEMAPHIEDFETKFKAWNDGGAEAGAGKRLAADTAQWETDSAAAQANGEKPPRKPNPNSYQSPAAGRHPAGMYHGSLLPVAKTTVRGVLFYQGENNSFGESWKPFYATFPGVVHDWRAALGDPDLPFGMVQIAGWSNRRSMQYDMNHHTNVVREIQFDTWQNTQNTGLVVSFDTNSNGSIHPGRKRPVGERSARWALAEVYNHDIEWRGPVFANTTFQDNKAIITFQEGTDRGLRLDQDSDVGFVLAGEDKIFHNARARVTQGPDKKPQLEVTCDAVPSPVAVRYAQSNLPIGGLMNARELPAYPFRSDTWPITPHQSTGSYTRPTQ